jgi:hypothetical protein
MADNNLAYLNISLSFSVWSLTFFSIRNVIAKEPKAINPQRISRQRAHDVWVSHLLFPTSKQVTVPLTGQGVKRRKQWKQILVCTAPKGGSILHFSFNFQPKSPRGEESGQNNPNESKESGNRRPCAHLELENQARVERLTLVAKSPEWSSHTHYRASDGEGSDPVLEEFGGSIWCSESWV